jgi:hypothetical protein
MEIGEVGQQTHLAVRVDGFLHNGDEVFVILVMQLAAELKAEDVSGALW